MRFNDFSKHFSTARINRYLIATNNSNTRAIKLYKANLKIAQSFHPLLGTLEVILRNHLNKVLEVHFSDPDWIINQKNGFMSHPSLIYIHKQTGKRITNDFLKREVTKAEQKLRNKNIPISSGKIIAEQSLGFWTDLFEIAHYRILLGKPIQIFNKLPRGFGRKEVYDVLTKIRRFRNRINHNEPICFSGNQISFQEINTVYQSIMNIFSWIDLDLVKFTREFDKVQKTVKQAQKI